MYEKQYILHWNNLKYSTRRYRRKRHETKNLPNQLQIAYEPKVTSKIFGRNKTINSKNR